MTLLPSKVPAVLEEAAAAAERSVALDAGNMRFRLVLANITAKRGDRAAARALLDRIDTAKLEADDRAYAEQLRAFVTR